ncbi:hypothetical protein [Sphingomonas aerolata]|jgi:hypothetical protein|uniref:hypothetical protein n=1 Tax=Sphingomonas aerolata TaxID=185951 RepID=UPI002FE312D5
MLIRSAFSLTLIVVISAGPASAKQQAKQTPESRFASCPGAAALKEAANVEWTEQPSRLEDHESLRKRLGVPMPVGSTRISLWTFGKHHTSVSYSLIVVRDEKGRWHTNGIGEEGPGLLPIEPRTLKIINRALSPEQGRALDQALADQCLYASPTFQRDPGIVSGGAVQTFEVETRTRRWVSSWFGVRTPQQDAVMKLLAD